MEKTIDDLKEGDEIEWEDSYGSIRTGTIYDLLEDNEWEVYVEYWRGNDTTRTEVNITDITKINGVKV